jgi:HrpA-like RNA helicase
VRAGHCWRLFSEEFFLSPRMDEHPLPEIQRVPLEEVVLQVRQSIVRVISADSAGCACALGG